MQHWRLNSPGPAGTNKKKRHYSSGDILEQVGGLVGHYKLDQRSGGQLVILVFSRFFFFGYL
jgi:hypothetical protein